MNMQKTAGDAKLPGITVVIPAYNEEKYLGATLDSLLQQDYPKKKLEIILADHNSTDSTVKIAKAHGVKVVHATKAAPHRVGAVRHEGAMQAANKTEIIVFTDADVNAPPNWLRKLMQPYDNPYVIGVQGAALPLDGSIFQTILTRALFVPYWGVMALLNHPSGPGSNFSIRKSTYFKLGGFDADLVTCEDIDLAVRATKLGKFYFLGNAPVYVSMRRVKKWGTIKFFFFHAINSLRYALYGRASEEYDEIR